MYKFLHVGIAILLSLLVFGCSSVSNVTSPTTDDMQSFTTEDRTIADNESYHWLMGYFLMYYDEATQTIDPVPVRNVDIHLNALKYLEQSPCTNCLKAQILGPGPGGSFNINITIDHPFPLLNLSVFDCRGIVLFNGSHTFTASGLTTSDQALGDGAVLNPEGYTTLYNINTVGEEPTGVQSYIKGKLAHPTTPNGEINAYKRFISDNPGNTRNCLYAGSSTTVQYQIVLPDQPNPWGYAIDGTWAKPTTTPVTNPITQFPDEANSPEPWKIEVSIDPDSVGLHAGGGSETLLIDVYDWQGQNTYDDPVVECPELFTGTLTTDYVSAGSGYATYEVTVPNSKTAAEGSYRCLISVLDDEDENSPDWLEFVAYQIEMLEVGAAVENQPPTAAANLSADEVPIGTQVLFTSDATDPDGVDDIETYQWDFSYDAGDGFQVDGSGDFTIETFDTPDTYTIQHRVIDSEGHSDLLDTPLTLTVTYVNLPPVAAAHYAPNQPESGQPVQFFDDSTDPDGLADIIQWQWDFSYSVYDGFNIESEDQEPQHVYTTGVYDAILRVKDTADHEDWLDSPLTVVVE